MARIGIDLGGTKTEVIMLDDEGRILFNKRVASEKISYKGTLSLISNIIDEAESTTGIKASVGVGMPGTLSPSSGLVKNSNTLHLNGRPIDVDLSDILQRPVRCANDANCFVLSEATDGAAEGSETVFGVILGTGVGGGIVHQSKILSGKNAIAGEWGHNPLPFVTFNELHNAHNCYCGRTGCIETWLSGTGFAAHFKKEYGLSWTSDAIWAARRNGHLQATHATDQYIEQLAKALASVINLIDPDTIVLGGGLSQIPELYTEVPQRWDGYIFSDEVSTQLVKPKYGDASGVRGAAWLWPK